MADWTIRVAQLPIGFGTPYKHNIIVVMDSAGRAVHEINGGPLDSNGNIVPFDDPRGPFAYWSGEFPVGAERRDNRSLFYRPDLNQRVVFSGTEEEVRRRVQAADACMEAINAANQKYTLLTGPSGGRDAPSTPTFNSNSVNATLLQCMGIPVHDPAITSQPGYQNPILSQEQVQQIREEQNPTAPPAARPPAGNIPIPRPQPKKRGDNRDGTNAPTVSQTASSVSPAPGDNAPADDSIPGGQPPPQRQEQPPTSIFADRIPQPADPQLKSAGQSSAYQQVAWPSSPGLPQHVIDTGNYLRANGFEITPRTMYVSHVLGPQAAVDLFKRTGSTSSDAVPSPDAATGDRMRAWARVLRLGPAATAGAIGGMAPAPGAAPASAGQPNDDEFAPSTPLA